MLHSNLFNWPEAERKKTTITLLPSSNGWKQAQKRQSTVWRTKLNFSLCWTNSKAWASKLATSAMQVAHKYSLHNPDRSRLSHSRRNRSLFLTADVNPHKDVEETMSDDHASIIYCFYTYVYLIINSFLSSHEKWLTVLCLSFSWAT